MTKPSRALCLWPVVAAGLLALGVMATGLRPPPNGGDSIAHSDCAQARQQKRQRHDWGWNVFNNRTEWSGLRLAP